MKYLTPFVNWGQSVDTVYIKIDLKDAEDPCIEFNENNITFHGRGIGVAGKRDYKFDLQLYSMVIAEDCSYKVCPRYIEVTMKKSIPAEAWPRLTLSTDKRAWLKIDFDHFMMDSNSEDNDNENNEINERIELKNRQAMRKTIEERNILNGATIPVTFKLVYLVLYNMFQMIGYTYIFSTLIVKYCLIGSDYKTQCFSSIHAQVACVLSTAVMEIVHPLFGWVKTSAFFTAGQVMGRCLVFFVLIAPQPLMQSNAAFFYLMLTWSSIEVIRYPYYALGLIKKNIGFLTWLRYTIWIPLYPIGFMLEGYIIMRSLPLLRDSGKYSLILPNAWNMSFPFHAFLQCYMIMLLPMMYLLMKRMQSQRSKNLPLRRYNKKSV